jgi:hypothetical protein
MFSLLSFFLSFLLFFPSSRLKLKRLIIKRKEDKEDREYGRVLSKAIDKRRRKRKSTASFHLRLGGFDEILCKEIEKGEKTEDKRRSS